MAFYTPSSTTIADLAALRAPALGGEFAVYASRVLPQKLGYIDFTSDTAGTMSLDAAVPLSSAKDLQLILERPHSGSANISVTLACLDNSGTPTAMNTVATIQPPGWAEHSAKTFQRHFATDFVPATSGKKITSITSLGAIVGAHAGLRAGIWYFPDDSDWQIIGCTDDVDFSPKDQAPLGIACGLTQDAFVKGGMTGEGKLTIKSKLTSFGDGLARYSGQYASFKVVLLKARQTAQDVLVFTNVWGSIKPQIGTGDSVAMVDFEAKYEDAGFFFAPYS